MSSTTLAHHRAQLQTMDTDDGRIAYLDLGPRTGIPLVLVHGMPTSSWLYRDVAQRLAGSGVRVIAVDLLGFGASDKPHDPEVYALQRQAARLVGLLDHLHLAKAVFVAHDLGGPWIFEVADSHPERFAALAVLNTSAYADAMTPPRQARMVGGPLGPMMLSMMRSRAGRPMVHRFFRDFTTASTTISRETTDAYWRSLHEGGTHAFRAFAVGLDETMGEFARHAAALRRLDVPATIIWGVEDPVLRPETLVPRFVADLRIADDDIHLLLGASHFLQEDRPEEVAALLAQFVAKHLA